jgi:siroheme synthase (precorrin-2 oxidase/ferrochelatase)
MHKKDDGVQGGSSVSLFPQFLKLGGRPRLEVGAETVGEGKIRALLEAGAALQLVVRRKS